MQIINRFRRIAGFAFAFAIFGSAQVFAQSTYQDKDAEWWSALEQQLTESTASEVAKVRQDAIQHIIFFAENYDEFVNFEEAAFEIMGRFESSDNVEERLLALAALSAIGENMTIKRLSVVAASDKSARVRGVAAAVVQAHSTTSS